MTTTIAFDTSTDSGTTLVRVHDGIFADNREPLLAALLQLADATPAHIVIDLSEVPVCDSAALNMLVQVHQRATATGGSLRLAAPQPMVRRILRVTNLDQLIPVQPDPGATPGA
jgi:anti-anti-sigma factor